MDPRLENATEAPRTTGQTRKISRRVPPPMSLGRGPGSISAISPLASIPDSSIRVSPCLGPSLPFFGQVNYPTVLQHINWCVRFAAEFPRSPRRPAQRRIHREDVRVFGHESFPVHGL